MTKLRETYMLSPATARAVEELARRREYPSNSQAAEALLGGLRELLGVAPIDTHPYAEGEIIP